MRAPCVSSVSLPSFTMRLPRASAIRASCRRGSSSSSTAPASTLSPSATAQRITGSASSAVTAMRSHSSVPTNSGGPSFAQPASDSDASSPNVHSTRMRASETLIEQRERVTQQGGAVDVVGREDAPPDRLGGEREQREPDHRHDQQARIEVRGQRAALLGSAQRLREQLRDLRRDL